MKIIRHIVRVTLLLAVIASVIYFSVVVAYYLMEPAEYRQYMTKLTSDSIKEKLEAVEWFLGKGEMETEYFRNNFTEGPGAAELVIYYYCGINYYSYKISNNQYPHPLLEAVTRGYLEAVKIIVGLGCDPNTRPDGTKGFPYGCEAPLHIAARKGYSEIVEYLLEVGADPDIDNWNIGHLTPLQLATSMNHIEIMRMLLDKGANPEGVDGSPWPPLVSALSNDNLEAVELLISRGANLSFSSVRFLIKNGADLSKRDIKGRTPLDVVREKKLIYKETNNKKCYEEQELLESILLKHGAKTAKELEE